MDINIYRGYRITADVGGLKAEIKLNLNIQPCFFDSLQEFHDFVEKYIEICNYYNSSNMRDVKIEDIKIKYLNDEHFNKMFNDEYFNKCMGYIKLK